MAGQSESLWRPCWRGVGALTGSERETLPASTTSPGGYHRPARYTHTHQYKHTHAQHRIWIYILLWGYLHKKWHQYISCFLQLSFEGGPAFSPRPIDMSNVTLSRDMQVGYCMHETRKQCIGVPQMVLTITDNNLIIIITFEMCLGSLSLCSMKSYHG